MLDKIAVLIPCYKESTSIAKVITDMKRELPEATIYVYDNNSTDGTDKIAREAGAIVRYEHQQGKEMSFAVCFGILMHVAISWLTEMILIPPNMHVKCVIKFSTTEQIW